MYAITYVDDNYVHYATSTCTNYVHKLCCNLINYQRDNAEAACKF